MIDGFSALSARVVSPLSLVRIEASAGATLRLHVTDSRGKRYIDRLCSHIADFKVGGALGWQRAELVNDAGKVIATCEFRVECQTQIDDGGAGYANLLRQLQHTMTLSCSSDGACAAVIGSKIYHFFICWLRDHTHTLKGMKYFSSAVKTGFELYADTQRDDGMVYERVSLKKDVQGWRDHTFAKGNFIKTLNAGKPNSATLQRIPVENDVEFLFIECLYRTWQTTGDTLWMSRYLDHAKNAVKYATSDPYRWSTSFNLLKRGYTIDTWDFLHETDSQLTGADNVCDIDTTTFGIMHGDNTGMAASCRMLASMMRAAGQVDAARYDELAADLMDRLDALAWNGSFYTHHISEDSSFKRDVGHTAESQQVSLSNTYALNRGIGLEKSLKLLETYKWIRDEMPAASPGEFYNIYPPFEKGFDGPDPAWQYMNGGVSTIAAGELARGAFDCGDDEYGVDILRRIIGLADRHGGHLNVCFNGNPNTVPPARQFQAVDLIPYANVTARYRKIGGWGEPGNDLSQMPTGSVDFQGIPFAICADGCGIGIAHSKAGFAREVRIPIGGRQASIYLLHTVSSADSPIAQMEVHYSDGTVTSVYIQTGKQLDGWFMPDSGEGRNTCHAPKTPKGWPPYQLAWRGSNDTFKNVGIFLWGWDNPKADVPIKEIVFRAADNASKYFIPAITLCDQPVWFPQNDVSYGIPDSWGAAAVVYALIEGVAGVADGSAMFETVDFSPRWLAADVDRATVHVTYPASGGYISYAYAHAPADQEINITIACSGFHIRCRLPLPEAAKMDLVVMADGMPIPFTVERLSESNYAVFALHGAGLHEVIVAYQSQLIDIKKNKSIHQEELLREISAL